jgi:xanthine dehydrogenase accessory factor
VEAEVKQRALGVMLAGGQPEVLTFCLDDNYGWDDGLICGGRMSMLVDPLKATANGKAESRPAAAYYLRFRELVQQGQGCTEAVVLKAEAGVPAGNRYLLDAQGCLSAQLGEGDVSEIVLRQLIPIQKRPEPYSQHGIAYLPILPRITLLIVGGGHVGQAVGRLAAEVDFDVWILDDRESFASPERFPSAKKRMVGDIGQSLRELVQRDVSPSTYCLIVTRGHAHDEEALYHLAATPAGYVGMIGSKRKIKLIYEDLVAKGVAPELLEKIHAPLGLEIGSQTVPEIAISIVAELIARRNLGTTQIPPRSPVQAGNHRP